MNKETVSKFYQKYKLLIFPSVVALSCLILISFVLIPQIGTFLKNSRSQQEFSVRSEFLDTKVAALENLNEPELLNKVGYVLTSLPREKDFAETIAILQKITRDHGFVIASLTFGAGGGQSFGVRMETVGPKTLLGSLLSSIEGSSRLMKISSMEISSGKGADVVSVNLALEALFAPMSATLGSIDTPLPEISAGEEALLSKLSSTAQLQPQPLSSTQIGKPNPFE